jgi:DNA polymerase III gamma/tau subunit
MNALDVESFRPRTLADMVGQEIPRKVLSGLLEKVRANPDYPVHNLLFYGPPGTGKSTGAEAFARELLGEDMEDNYCRTNASDERNLAVIQEKIIPYLQMPPTGNAPRRILFMDESDGLTDASFQALRVPIEEAQEHGKVIVIFAVNHLSKVIPAIQSRCLKLFFGAVSDEQLKPYLEGVATKLGIPIEEDRLKLILRRAHGRPRDALIGLLGDRSENDPWEQLEHQVVHLLTPNGSSVSERIERFVEYLATSGYSNDDFAEVIEVICDTARDHVDLVPREKLHSLYYQGANHAARMREVDSPLLQVRGFLYNEMRA